MSTQVCRDVDDQGIYNDQESIARMYERLFSPEDKEKATIKQYHQILAARFQAAINKAAI